MTSVRRFVLLLCLMSFVPACSRAPVPAAQPPGAANSPQQDGQAILDTTEPTKAKK
jgi:hypothetical protein